MISFSLIGEIYIVVGGLIFDAGVKLFHLIAGFVFVKLVVVKFGVFFNFEVELLEKGKILEEGIV